jgi:hypothetical protein
MRYRLAQLLRSITMLIISFDKNIKFDGRTFHFRFYGFNSRPMGKIFMIAAHHDEEHFVFHMKLSENGTWVIINDGPTWVNEIGGHLSSIIMQEMKKTT